MKTTTASELRIGSLYHYQAFRSEEQKARIARIFTDKTLYFSNPEDFNDPWDCKPCYNRSDLDNPARYEAIVQWLTGGDRFSNKHISEEELRQRTQKLRSDREFLELQIDRMSSDMEKAISGQYRVYCLSTLPDSILMWAHYADSYRGVCFEFSARDDLFGGALKVEYLDSYPSYDLASDDDDENIRPLLTKSIAWICENEFRVIGSEIEFPGVPKTNNGFISLPPGALRSVIIGPLMSSEDRTLIGSLVSGLNVQLKVANRVKNRYALEINPF